ncbi:MAG: flagellar basal body-associated FliL family protein [Alphaproteobacteria bacterium]|nr:flagellar basal body-associated FliL family protein [Alphaproteobacteria bacterium]
MAKEKKEKKDKKEKASKEAEAETEGAEGAEGEEGEGAGKAKRKISPKLMILIGGPLVAIVAVVGLLFAFGVIGGSGEETAETAAHGEEHAEAGSHGEASHGEADGHAPGEAGAVNPHDLVFFELEEIIANLNTDGNRKAFLKLTVALELDKSVKLEDLEPLVPRIRDQFQVYLRELRLEDLSGSAGMFRLKEELLRRVNLAVRPQKVRDVLFKEMVVQ